MPSARLSQAPHWSSQTPEATSPTCEFPSGLYIIGSTLLRLVVLRSLVSRVCFVGGGYILLPHAGYYVIVPIWIYYNTCRPDAKHEGLYKQGRLPRSAREERMTRFPYLSLYPSCLAQLQNERLYCHKCWANHLTVPHAQVRLKP